MRFFKFACIVFVITVHLTGTGFARSIANSFAAFVLDTKSAENERDAARFRIYQGCISCHDGTVGSDVSVETVSSKRMAGMSAIAASHPVGMNYNESYARKMGGLVSRQSLPPEIVLVNGQVTCLSCHKIKETVRESIDGDSGILRSSTECTSSKEITVSHWQQNLCVSCHQM